MLKIAKLMEDLSEADRRQVAFFVHRTYGGSLSGAQRAAAFRQRWEQPPPRNEVTESSNGDSPLRESATSTAARTSFKVPESIEVALKKCQILGTISTLQSPGYWQSEVRANPGVNYAAELLKAEAWMHANPDRAPRKNFARFIHTWLARADRGGT